MKYFLKKIILFIGIGIVPFLIFYSFIVYNHVFLPSEMYYSNEYNESFTNGNKELIAIGNSKLLSSLNKTVIEKKLDVSMANLGYSSANISISKLVLETYLDRCIIQPKYVLLEVSWFTFNKRRTNFHAVSGDLFLKNNSLYKYFNMYPKAYTNLKSTITLQVKNLVFKTQDIDYSIIKKNKSSFNKLTFNRINFENNFPNHKAGNDSKLRQDFNEIVNLCTSNGIILILYTAPESEAFFKLQKDNTKIIKTYTEVAKINDSIVYLNYTYGGKLYNKEHEKWLYDSQHIYEDTMFTEILVSDIIKYTK